MNNTKIYDLQERTALFGESIIDLCKSIKLDSLNRVILNQLLRSGTSIGANYCEANGASSRKDFRNKVFIAKKEAQETLYWLRMLIRMVPSSKNIISELSIEAQELVLILQKITSTLREKEEMISYGKK